jgi:hypothetical protein
MKIKFAHLLLLALIAPAACMPAIVYVPPESPESPSLTPSPYASLTPLPSATMTPTLSTLPLLPTPTFDEFTDDWRIHAELRTAILEYFYYRKRAFISNDLAELWSRYPDLRENVDFLKGINAEEIIIGFLQGGNPLIDGNIDLQHYEPIKIKMFDGKAEVHIHGQEIFLRIDENGDFREAGHEFRIVLFLEKLDGKWTVYKTDQYRQGAE